MYDYCINIPGIHYRNYQNRRRHCYNHVTLFNCIKLRKELSDVLLRAQYKGFVISSRSRGFPLFVIYLSFVNASRCILVKDKVSLAIKKSNLQTKPRDVFG